MPPGEDAPAAPAAHALALMDRILAERPDKNGPVFSEATRCLCAYRDALIRRQGGADASAAERTRLERVNAVISVMLGGHFPLGTIPWDEIAAARGWIQALAEAEAA